MSAFMNPSSDCASCPRLAGFRAEQRAAHPDWFNAPVPVLGTPDVRLAIVGLAPGLKGANRTGRAFTGDLSGELLFAVLQSHGLAEAGPEGPQPRGTFIVNAVRCVPPANRPTAAELRACRPHLAAALQAAAGLRTVVALGRIAHDATVTALGENPRHYRFGHGAEHRIGPLTLIDSYHCSRYNQNIGRITYNMLWSIFDRALRSI